jgi:hypothetical protein
MTNYTTVLYSIGSQITKFYFQVDSSWYGFINLKKHIFRNESNYKPTTNRSATKRQQTTHQCLGLI